MNGQLASVTAQIHPLEAAKLNVSLAYCLSSLEWMQSRAAGQEPLENSIAGERDRIKASMQLIAAAAQKQQASGNEKVAGSSEKASTASDSSDRTKVDGAAAGRLVRGALAANTRGGADSNDEDAPLSNETSKKHGAAASWKQGKGKKGPS